MTTTSRGISQKLKHSRASHTPGKDKGINCTKSPLKTFGMNANPYKLKGHAAKQFVHYSAAVRSLNK